MTKKDLFVGLAVFVFLFLVGKNISAQDMVFSAQDTGEVAEPPPEAQGPPSEALANALRLYQQESYAQAAVQFQRVVQKETGDEPGNVQKAQFFLGKCFYHLKFYQAALGVFEEIALMSTGHLFFSTTLQWLAQLARELPEAAGIVSLVGRYGDSISVLQQFNTSETSDLYNELLYLMGKNWYQRGEFAKARDFFLEIDVQHENFIRAIFFVGITHVRERRAEPAAKAFLQIIDKFDGKLFLSYEEKRYLNLAWLSIARIYYSTKHYESAMAAWAKIPQSSEYYLDALFEESWAHFQIDQLDRALGNIHTINSPYFEEFFYPESIILKAVIYFGMCMFEDAQQTVEYFRKKYEPFQQELQATLARFNDNKAFYEYLIKIRNTGNKGQIDEKGKKKENSNKGEVEKSIVTKQIEDVMRGALGDRTLLRNIDYIDMLNAEEEQLKKMPSAFINSGAGIRIQQDINTAKTVAVDNTGNMVRSRYERLLSEIHDFMNQGTRVEIEILKALRGELDIEISAEQEVTGLTIKASKVSSDAEHQLWPFEGEFWRDELGYYRQPISNRCGR